MDKLALVLAIIGAVNWGSIGIFSFDIIGFFLGGQNVLFSRILFALVGIAGLWCITLLFREDEPTRNHKI